MADTNAPGAPLAAPTTETTADATAPLAAVDTAKPSPLEAFARKERQIRRMQEQLQRDRQAMEAKQKQYETDYVPKSRLKEDFWTVAQEAGLDYNQLTEQVLAQPNDPATKALMAKMHAMEAKMRQADEAKQSEQQKQYDNAKKQLLTQAKMLVDGDPEFETIKTLELYEDVVSRIEAEYHETGIVRDVKEVAMELENELIEDAIKFSQLAKVQARLKPKTEEPLQAKQTQKPTITITNRMESQPAKRSSEQERIQRAIAAFKGNAQT